MNRADERSLYDAFYFQHCCGKPYERTQEWLDFFGNIADTIVRRIQPQTVLDVGCAMGFLVEGLRERDVEADGIDVSEYAIRQVRPDLQSYCRVSSILEPLSRRYDLIVSIEVLEHLSPALCENAIKNICTATDDVLFSSTPFDYREPTHVNVQPIEYWAELFALNGFVRDFDFDASFITPWAVRFRKTTEPLHRIIRLYERREWALRKENEELRGMAVDMRNQLAAKESSAILSMQSKETIEMLKSHLAERDQRIERMMNARSSRWAEAMRTLRFRLAPSQSQREKVFLSIWQRVMGK